MTNQVSYAESVNITGKRAGEFIQKALVGTSPQKIILCNPYGEEPYGPQETDVYGFKLNKKTSFFRRIFGLGNPYLVGYLYFANEQRKATHKKWLLEVCGREHVEFFRNLANNLAEEFGVEIHVRLESEQPDIIDYLSDLPV